MKAKVKRPTRPKVSYVTQGDRKIAVQMKIEDFQAFMERVEDLEDAIDFLEAKRTATGFVDWKDLKKDLAKKHAASRVSRSR